MKRLILIAALLLLLAGCDSQDSTENLVMISGPTYPSYYNINCSTNCSCTEMVVTQYLSAANVLIANSTANELRLYEAHISAQEFSMIVDHPGSVFMVLTNNNTANNASVEYKLTNNGVEFGMIVTSPAYSGFPNSSVITTDSPSALFIESTDAPIYFNSYETDIDVLTLEGSNATINGSLEVSSGIYGDYDDTAYIFAHAHANMTLPGVGQWINVTFDGHPSEVNRRFTHTYNDGTNHTFTVQRSGIYKVNYRASFSDAAANPTGHVVTRVANNGIEINGSAAELDTRKQYSDVEIIQAFLVELSASDDLQFQWTATATTISLNNHGYYAAHPTSTTLTIQKID